MQEGGAQTWRDLVERHHLALLDELTARLDSELSHAVSEAVAAERSRTSEQIERAREESGRSRVESLNQLLRRLRAADAEQVLPLLAEGCAPYTEQLVVLVFESNQARAVAAFGISNQEISFETASAPAIVAAIDSRDLVVSLAAGTEISPVLAEAFGTVSGAASDRKAYLFPVVARHSVMAMLVASGVSASALIELLCEAAGISLETAPAPASPASEVAPASPNGQPRAWEDLTADDQKLHLQAQRMARLRVAEMRVYHENDLKRGAAAGDIYGALKNEIDAARDQFMHTFLSRTPTMVDYLHLEILRSLAHEDDRLLGRNYPGPMV